ncbi:hypothetical protein Q3G72_017217 [Acer saccharum]|nr:hypothetical protein Q3G72_017217 [Acer saccharum]
MAAKCGGGGGGDSDECITRYTDAGSYLESLRYFLSRRTVLEMLRDRGYDVSDSELALSLSLSSVPFSATSPTRKDSVSTSLSAPTPPKRESLQGLILILQSQVTAYAKKEMDKFSFKVELFQLLWMLETDAIARYYGLERGQVVKVTYSGGIVDALETYRCVSARFIQ